MNIIGRILAVFVTVLMSVGATVSAADKGFFATEPKTNNGQRWRLGYYEGGEYIDYQKILIETVRGLMKLGWVETTNIPPQKGEQTEQLWQWFANDLKSDYIEFVRDGHYSANWDDTLREQTVKTIINRLEHQQDIDLMVAMGTWAGKDLANDRHSTPTMVLSASDPLSAGIIKSVENSGYAHVHATVDPNRYERQLKVFHDIFGFKRLGVTYENTVSGRSYAATEVIETLSRERGFEIVPCHTQSDISDTALAEKSVINCFEKLAKTSDAIYVTVQGGVNARSIPELVRLANEYHVPTFSQSGSDEVKQGLLVSLSQAGFRYVGEFHASTFAKVFNGAAPNDLDQLFEEPPKMAINLKTAENIGFNPPLLLLGAADEIFNE